MKQLKRTVQLPLEKPRVPAGDVVFSTGKLRLMNRHLLIYYYVSKRIGLWVICQELFSQSSKKTSPHI